MTTSTSHKEPLSPYFHPSLNEEQIKATTPDASFWVMASAGTGKTKILIDRILRLLLEGTEPQRIVCITYTKAAAHEMRERLLKKLHTWTSVDEAPLHADLALLNAADKASLARTLFHTVFQNPPRIQTIHSLCQSILLKSPFAAGLLPDFKVLGEAEKTKLIQSIFEDVLKDPLLEEQFHTLSSFMGEAHFKACLAECIQNRLKIKSPPDFNHIINVPPSPPYDYAAILKAAETISQKGPASLVDKARLLLDQPSDENALFDLFLTSQGSPRKILERDYANLCILIAEHKLAHECKAIIKLHEAFHPLLMNALERYKARKFSLNFLDFDDVIEKTHTLLLNYGDGDLLQSLDASFDHLMLDEAQDTSPIQWEIILALLAHFFESPAKNHNPRTIFVVGDMKQSIYSFQGADVDGYLHAQKYLSELLAQSNFSLTPISLSACYRSTPEILSLVDRVLSHESIKTTLPQHSDHIPHRKDEIGYVELWPLEDEITKESIIPWHLPRYGSAPLTEEESLAKKIALRIDALLQSRIILPSTAQEITASDILILTRKRTTLFHHISSELSHRNIPCAGLDRITLSDHLFIKDILAFVEFLDLPENDLNLGCLLKSLFFGFSENDLIRLCTQRGYESLWHSLKQDRLSSDAVSTLKYVQEYSIDHSLYPLIHTLCQSVLPRAQSVFGSTAEDLTQALLSIALSYESQGQASLKGFITFVKEEGQNIRLDPSYGTEHGVRLMTVHGAKGLESPVVIIADAGDEPLSTHGDVIFYDKSYNIRTSHSPLKSLKEKDKQKLIYESHRLLYVAMTRAQDYLIVCGINRSAEDSWHALIAPFVKEGPHPFPSSAAPATHTNPDPILSPIFHKPLENEPILTGKQVSTQEIERGKALHKLFEITTLHKKPITNSILSIPPFNTLTQDDLEKVRRLHQKIDITEGYAELSITTSGGQVLRLDFVKIDKKAHSITILDYKSTSKNHHQHTRQLYGYKEALTPMFPGYDFILGLVYMDEEDILMLPPLPKLQHVS